MVLIPMCVFGTRVTATPTQLLSTVHKEFHRPKQSDKGYALESLFV
jgi:hypothetical protein